MECVGVGRGSLRMPDPTAVKLTPELRQRIAQMPEMPRTFALAIIAYGPMSAKALAEACDQKTSWVYNSANQLRGRLAPFGELMKDDTGYWIRVETVKPPAAVLPIVRKPVTEPPAVAFQGPVHAHFEARRRRLYVFPWGGHFEIGTEIGITLERDCVVIQLRGGGYIRSPARQDARVIVDDLTALACDSDLVDVVNKVSVKS
jgi:hypothetical protein